MAARRVNDLAKEWGLEPKDLTARLDKLGMRNKRAASLLTDEEVQRAMNELGLGDRPQVTIGGERVVTGETGQQLVERRVGSKVIRRRAAASADSDSGQLEPLEALGGQGEVLQAFSSPEPLAEAFDIPVPPPPMPEPVAPIVDEPPPIRVEAPEAEAPPPVEPTPVAAPVLPRVPC